MIFSFLVKLNIDFMKGQVSNIMSTVFCSEKGCAYQKDGRCNLNAIKTQTVKHPHPSGCFYYRNKELNLLENGAQNQEK